ncbi:MAG: LysR family transcriptional regulator [Gammaproteobacteria bacterium]|nr:LysR family transcriptional regulator [Gammaproteobacteria bacterium]
MKLVQLQYVSVVAEQGSFSSAARQLGVAQPALSQQIKLLEEELGTTLFLRSQSGAEPTESGLILVDHAERIIEQVELARHDTLTNGNVPSGDVSLVIANAISNTVLPKLVAEIGAKYPKIALRVRSDTSSQVQLALENGRIDLGILPSRPTLTKVDAIPLVTEQMYFICKAGFQKSSKHDLSITLEQCLLHPMALVRVGQPFRLQLEEISGQHNLTFNVKYESNSLQMIRSYVESGLACSILPWCAVEEKVLAGKIDAKLIVQPEISQKYIVAWPKIRPLNLPSRTVLDVLSNTVSDEIGSE